MEKECTLCGKVKPIAEFSKSKIGRHGITHRCRHCLSRKFDALEEAPCDECPSRERCFKFKMSCRAFVVWADTGRWHRNLERQPDRGI